MGLMGSLDQTEISARLVAVDRMDQMAHVRATLTAALAIQAELALMEEAAVTVETAVTGRMVAPSRLLLSKDRHIT